MPISDQVIELETKKKGRNAIFIVLISLLAAASVAFAVLWVTKAPAVDPPAIDKISIGYTDMSQTSTDSSNNAIYTVTSTSVYTIEFDLALKEGTEITDVNSLIKVESQPAGEITQLQGSGLIDPQNPTRYTYKFRINSSRDSFDVVAASTYNADVKIVFKIMVKNDSHTETFDLGKDVIGEKTIYNFTTSATATTLSLDNDKSSNNLLYYKGDTYLTYFAPPFTNKTYYRFDVLQLGALGINGQYAKVSSNGGADAVKLEVGTGASYEGADFRTVNPGSGVVTTPVMDFYYGAAFMGEYCNDSVIFMLAAAAEKVYLRLTANVSNDSQNNPQIVVELQVKSTNDLDKITEIIFVNPYTGIPTESGTTKDTLYLYATGSAINYDLADCIMVKRGSSSEAEKAEFGTYNLVVTKRTQDNVISINGASELVTIDSTKTGSDIITISDKESGNLGATFELTVRVCAALDEFTFLQSGNGSVSGNEYTVDIASGTKVSVPFQFGVSMLRLAELSALKFNSELNVTYPKGITPVSEAKDSSIYITGISIDKLSTSLNPPLSLKAANSQLVTGTIEFVVGKGVESNADGYVFTFDLAPQGIEKQALTFSVKLLVTQLATSFELDEDYVFENPDSYTQLNINGDNRASITLAIGSVSSGYTEFTLKDILKFYVDEKPTDDSRGLNYGGLSFEFASGKVSDIFNASTGKFVVPLSTSAVPAADIVELVISLPDYSYRLRINYIQPVVGVVIGNESSITELSYSGGFSVGNMNIDKLEARSLNNTVITDTKYIQDTSLFNVDLFVKTDAGSGIAALLMPKKQFGEGMAYYYFLPGTDLSTAKSADAVFFMSHDNNIMKNHEITLTKDLYSLSVQNNLNLQDVRIYYSYGKSEDIFNLTDTPAGQKLESLKNPLLVAFSEYHFIRKYDGVKLYSDLYYTEESEITSESLTYPNGSSFVVAGSGIVILSDSSVDVVERTQLNKKLNLATVGLDIDYDKTHLTLKNDVFTVNIAEDGGDSVVIKYTENNNGRHSAQVTIDVSNDALGIESVKLYADSNYGTEFDGAVLYKHDGIDTVTIYYIVTYKNRLDGSYTTFESFAFDYNAGEEDDSFNVTQTALPVFGDSPVDYDLSKTPGFSYSEGVYVYKGSITFKLMAPAEIGTEEIVVKGGISGGKAFTHIKITSLIESVYATVNVNSADVILSADSTAPATEYIQFAYSEPITDSADKSNSYDFMFTFKNGYVDYSNLKFDCTISGVSADSGVKSEYVYGSDNTVIGVRLIFGNYRIVNGLFSFKITETNPSDDSVKEYVFNVTFGVDVPVENLELTVSGNGLTEKFAADGANKEFYLNIVSSGNGETKTYGLTSVINGGVSNKQPIGTVQYKLIKENATDSVFALSGSNLTVKNALSATPTALEISVGDFTVLVHLTLSTSKLEMDFANPSAIPDDITDDSEINFGVKIVNAGTGSEVTDATATYKYERVYGDFTATVSNSGVFKLTSGGYGMVRVIAEYTYSGGTLTVSKTLGVNVPLSNTVELIGSGDAQVSSLNLTVGQAGTQVSVKVKYAVAALGYAELDLTKLSVLSSNPGVAGLSVSGSNVTVLPISSGSAVINVNYNGNTASINVTVSEVVLPTLGLTATVTEFDVFSNTLSSTLEVNSDKPSQITISAPTADNSDLFTVSGSGTSYTLTVNKNKITASTLGKHVITVTATVKETNETLTATIEITLTAGSYTPEIAIKSGSATVTQIDRANTSGYTFGVSNLPTGYGESASVVFASNVFNLNNAGNTATIIGVNNAGGSSDTVTATVTLFGTQYTRTYTYTVVDNGTLTSAVYYLDSAVSDLTSLISSNGTVSTSLKTVTANGLPIDFDGSTAQKAIVLVTEYTNAPMAVLNADRKSFTVATPAALTLIDYDVVVKGGKYYYIAQYAANKAGDVSFAVSTVSLGGKTYSASPVSAKLTATAPNFSISTESITLALGMEAVLEINSSNLFKGDVTYEFALADGGNVLTLQSGSNKNSVKIVAATGVTSGCDATVTVNVTVTSGAYAGLNAEFTAKVKVDSYVEPTFTVKNDNVLLTSKNAYDMSDNYTVTHDNNDASFAYTLTFVGASNGTISNHTYTPSAANGSYDTIYYTFKVTGGYFVGKEVTGSFTITVEPQVTIGGAVSIYSGDSYNVLSDLNVSADLLSGIGYTLDNANAGTVTNDGVFTAANGFTGNVTVTVNATVTYNGHSKNVSLTKQITVFALGYNESVSNGVHTYTATGADGATFTLTAEENGQLVTISGSGSVFTVTEKTDKAGGTVKLKLTMTVSGAQYVGAQKEYYEFIYITVDAAAVPTVTVTNTSNANGGQINATVTGGYSATYEYELVGNGITLNPADGSYTFNKVTENQTAVVKVTATISGAPYDGEVIVAYSEEITVTAAAVPTVTVTNTSNANGGQINATVSGGYSATYKYELVGSGITLNPANGSYTFNKVTENQTAVVKVTATISGAPYDNVEIVEYSEEITVTAAAKPQVTVTVDNVSNKINATVSGGYSANYKYEVIGSGITVDASGNYTITETAEQQTAIVKVTATISGAPYDGEVIVVYSDSITVSAATKPEVTLTETSTENGGKITPSITGGYTATYTYEVIGNGVTVDNDGNYTITKSTAQQTAVIKVTATVSGAPYNGTVIVVYGKEITVPAEDKPTITATDDNSGTVTVSIENATIVYSVVKGGEYVNITETEDGFTYTFNTGAYGNDIEILISATVNSGAYSGYTFTKSVSLTAPEETATPDPEPAPDGGNEGGDNLGGDEGGEQIPETPEITE